MEKQKGHRRRSGPLRKANITKFQRTEDTTDNIVLVPKESSITNFVDVDGCTFNGMKYVWTNCTPTKFYSRSFFISNLYRISNTI